MNVSPEVVAQIQQQCMLEARREYDDLVQQANMQLAHMRAINEQLTQDKSELYQFLKTKVDEILLKESQVEEYKQTVIQQHTEIADLTRRINGLEEEASESAKDVKDLINTNDALLLERDKLKDQVSSQQSALTEKDEQINILMAKHNRLVHKNKENEEVIASLIKDRECCQCKVRSEGEIMREAVPVSMSNDSLSSFNPQHNQPQLLVTDNVMYDTYSLSNGKPMSESKVRREIGLTTVDNSLSNLELQQKPSALSSSDDHFKRRKSHLSKGSVKCTHLDDEQEAMIGKILQTTSKTALHCKAKIGSRRCSTDRPINMCLKCGAMLCHDHLYESHSKEHTVFMKMKNKTIWCYSCKCDPLSSNTTGHAHNVASLHKEKSSMKHKTKETTGLNQPSYNFRNRKLSDHHSRSEHRRSKSSSQSPSEAAVTTAMAQQLPSHHLPINQHLPTSTSGAYNNSTQSYLASTGVSTDRHISADVTSSGITTHIGFISTSVINTPEDCTITSTALANKFPTTYTTNSSMYTLSSNGSLISESVGTATNTSATMPCIGSKQTTSTSETKLPGRNTTSSLKSSIKQRDPIKPIKPTHHITAIVPVTSYNSSISRSQTAYSNPSTKFTSPPTTSRSSTLSTFGSSAYDDTAGKPTWMIMETESPPCPAGSSFHRRSWSFDRLELNDLSPFKGLVNTGLTCFFNSAVQGLSRIDQFSELLTKLFKPGCPVKVHMKKPESCITVTIPEGEDGKVSKYLSSTIKSIRKKPVCKYEKYFDPSKLLTAIQTKYSTNFRPYRQGDAHEVMRCILDAVRMEEIEKVKRGIKKQYTGSENGDVETLLNGEDKLLCKAALRGAHKVHTYIDQVVGGELLSVVICDYCKHRAELIEPFLDISLPIPDKMPYTISHEYTLKECFEEYTSKDKLDDDNKFICSNCSGKGDDIELRRAVKQLKLQTLPEVFIIHLKRFSIDHIVKKNSMHVKYHSPIDVRPYCTEQLSNDKRQSTRYSLFAVIQHIGTLNFGHYTAYIKIDDHWYKADDSWVTEVTEREALNQEAYILFYERYS